MKSRNRTIENQRPSSQSNISKQRVPNPSLHLYHKTSQHAMQPLMPLSVDLPILLNKEKPSPHSQKMYRGLYREEQQGRVRYVCFREGNVTKTVVDRVDGVANITLVEESMHETLHKEDILHVFKKFGELTANSITSILRERGFNCKTCDVKKMLKQNPGDFFGNESHGQAVVWSAACIERTSFDDVKDLADIYKAKLFIDVKPEDMVHGARINATLLWKDDNVQDPVICGTSVQRTRNEALALAALELLRTLEHRRPKVSEAAGRLFRTAETRGLQHKVGCKWVPGESTFYEFKGPDVSSKGFHATKDMKISFQNNAFKNACAMWNTQLLMENFVTGYVIFGVDDNRIIRGCAFKNDAQKIVIEKELNESFGGNISTKIKSPIQNKPYHIDFTRVLSDGNELVFVVVLKVLPIVYTSTPELIVCGDEVWKRSNEGGKAETLKFTHEDYRKFYELYNRNKTPTTILQQLYHSLLTVTRLCDIFVWLIYPFFCITMYQFSCQ